MGVRDPDVEIVKRRLRLARCTRRFTQVEAAERAGISRSVLVKYEARHNDRIPNTRQLFRLAEVYELSVDFLLGRTDDFDIDHKVASSSSRKPS